MTPEQLSALAQKLQEAEALIPRRPGPAQPEDLPYLQMLRQLAMLQAKVYRLKAQAEKKTTWR